MNDLYVISPNEEIGKTLENMIKYSTKGIETKHIYEVTKDINLKNKKLLFVAKASNIGYDIPIINFLWALYKMDPNAFEGSTGAIFVSSVDEEGTKRLAQDIIYIANNMGCAFIGHPLVEATSSFKNFLTWQKTLDMSLEEICYTLSERLIQRLINDKAVQISKGKILVLYSMPHSTSNTLDLWHMVANKISSFEIKEVQIESGKIIDCKGCPYTICRHFGKNNGCFYGGGVMSKDVLPAIEEADAVVWLCPNYNDALSANLTAVINRITALYRRITFYNKSIFAVIVSGNSGSDSVARQVIGALNINKGFRLPPYFSIRTIANDPKVIFSVENIKKRSEDFAESLMKNISREEQ